MLPFAALLPQAVPARVASERGHECRGRPGLSPYYSRTPTFCRGRRPAMRLQGLMPTLLRVHSFLVLLAYLRQLLQAARALSARQRNGAADGGDDDLRLGWLGEVLIGSCVHAHRLVILLDKRG